MKTNHRFFTLLLLLCALLPAAGVAATQPTGNPACYVDPFIGTGVVEGGLRGNNFPGATVPFGMIQLSPDTREAPDWDCPAGYAYEENSVYGFSHTHLSGTGAADLIDILLLPVSQERRQSRISHEHEAAHPGYYSVLLEDDSIQAELTATTHVGIHRYTYPDAATERVYLDLDHSAAKGSWGRRIEKAQLRIVDPYTVEGYRFITGWAPLRKVCFSICFSRPIIGYDLWNDGRNYQASIEAERQTDNPFPLFTANGTDLKATLTFAPGASRQVEARVGLSAVSVENARQNRELETASRSFDALCSAATDAWNTVLGRVRATFPTQAETTIFYTALYHAMLQPTVFSDACGDYVRGNYSIGNCLRQSTPAREEAPVVYTMFSIWDTYRAAHALYDLLQPQRARDMVNSMIDHAEAYGYLPIWELWGEDNYLLLSGKTQMGDNYLPQYL